MKATELKEKLHHYIDTADEVKLLEIYKIIEDEDTAYSYSTEDLAMLYKRRTSYLNGEGKNYTTEESINSIRK